MNRIRFANTKDLQQLQIKTNEFGFTVWNKETARWIIDGSTFLTDGAIKFSDRLKNESPFIPIYDPEQNNIRIIVTED